DDAVKFTIELPPQTAGTLRLTFTARDAGETPDPKILINGDDRGSPGKFADAKSMDVKISAADSADGSLDVSIVASGKQPAAISLAQFLSDASTPPRQRVVDLKRNITYGKAGDQPLRLDLYYSDSDETPRPAIVFFTEAGDELLHRKYRDFCQTLADEHGFIAARADYRPLGSEPYPAPLQDCRAALGWLRSKADNYHIDPKRIAVGGFSLGAHLAAMLALTENGDASSQGIQAVVALNGVFDLAKVAENKSMKPLLKQYLGAELTNDPDLYRDASPIHLGLEKSPPLLFVVSNANDAFDPKNAQAMRLKLNNAKVPLTWKAVNVANVTYGIPGGKPRAGVYKKVGEFLREHLRFPEDAAP
ncbi:MAG: alpha/beta hydrolase, partial [Planctomycetales bacterium]